MNKMFPNWKEANIVLSELVDRFFNTVTTVDSYGSVEIESFIALKDIAVKTPEEYLFSISEITESVLNDRVQDMKFYDSFRPLAAESLKKYIHSPINPQVASIINDDIKIIIEKVTNTTVEELKETLRAKLGLETTNVK